MNKVCALAAQGVAAIFGPQSSETSNHVQSTCDVLNIPHMQIRWDFRLEAANQSVNLYPHPLMLSRALRDLVKTKNWKVHIERAIASNIQITNYFFFF